MKKKIILVGAGSHANSCIDVIECENKFSIIGVCDNKKPKSKLFKKYKYIGNDTNLKKARKLANNAIVSIGLIKDYSVRNLVFKKLKNLKFNIPKIISPSAYVSKNVKVGSGSIIFHNVILNINVSIGLNCIINTNSLIEHDVKIGNNSHISTGAIINGNVTIGNNTFIGSGSIVSNNVKIGNNCFVRMGSKVIKNLKNNTKI